MSSPTYSGSSDALHDSSQEDGPTVKADANEAVSVKRCLKNATEWSWRHLLDDYHWYGEVSTNVTNTSEYVMAYYMLGQPLEKDLLRKWFWLQQNPDGSFGWGVGEPGNLSASVEAYFALKLLGEDIDGKNMRRNREWIRSMGGAAGVRIFTRIYLAVFGLMPYDVMPQMPPEFIFIPPWFPFNVYKLSSWARSVCIPWLVVLHHRPVWALPNGTHADNHYLDELWLDPSNKHVPYMESLPKMWAKFGLSFQFIFAIVDVILWLLGGLRWTPFRKYANKRCIEWILERQEPHGDWAGYCPPVTNGLYALICEGFTIDSDPVKRGLAAYEAFSWEDERGKRVQASLSPVWDTALMMRGMIDAGVPRTDHRLAGATEWMRKRQILDPIVGDWRVYRPNIPAGGWAFEYHNTWYPDTDDAAAVILGMVFQNPEMASHECVRIGVEWLLGMQSTCGGWAAFDVDNDKLWFNDIPFADIKALADYPSADVTGRIVECFGILMKLSEHVPGVLPGDQYRRVQDASRRAIAWYARIQEDFGGWWGRWGCNYVYGTSKVLCAVSHHTDLPEGMVRRACEWLQSVQQPSGAWGEDFATYDDRNLAGKGRPTASQTAWGVMSLLTYLPPDHYAIVKGVQWLLDHQACDGTWVEPESTATGFPQALYMRYDYYRHYFPLMALGRYARQRGMIKA